MFKNFGNINNVPCELDAGISVSDVLVPVVSGQGTRVGTLTYPARATLIKKDVSGNIIKREVVEVSSRAGDVFTIVRAQESTRGSDTADTQTTTALSFDAGDTLYFGITAGDLKDVKDQILLLASKTGIQDESYTYGGASAVGTDAYAVTLTPALTAYAEGQKISFKTDVANTGACTLNVNGLGAKALKIKNDQDPANNDLEAGQIIEVRYDGTNFQITNQVAGEATVSKLQATMTVIEDVAQGDAIGEVGGVVGVSFATYVQQYNPAENADNRGLRFKPDGTEMYIKNSGSTMYQYTLSTPFDISTATHTRTETIAQMSAGFDFSPDGTQLFVTDSNEDIEMYDLSTAWDISTAVLSGDQFTGFPATSFQGFVISNDGVYLFTVDQSDVLKRATMSTPFDVTTAIIDAQTFNVGTQNTTPRDIHFSTDGLKFYMLGTNGNDTVYQYTLTVAWDLTTMTYDTISYDANTQVTNGWGLYFSPDRTKFYICDQTDGDIHEYDLAQDPDNIIGLGKKRSFYGKFIGFANEAILADASGSINIAGTDANQSGLTAGLSYYADPTTDGAIATTGGLFVGIAISATEITINPSQSPTEDFDIVHASIAVIGTSGSATITHNLGVKPSLVIARMITGNGNGGSYGTITSDLAYSCSFTEGGSTAGGTSTTLFARLTTDTSDGYDFTASDLTDEDIDIDWTEFGSASTEDVTFEFIFYK
jgi:hypothetical protein